ncbi:hypothetical protein [Thalassobellus suaedae]|uniref:Uncharacterized protein n=1 Tax=Thalassobellus suaedae TaxID=3074124 RepID=A0ABY9XWL5_9FLAO|nr:hypothetical protein RHP51_05470 [Flavobacteriaceae bacterium HL-DH14]WNH12121.1 hypothetical protein RHP49_14650 [Flavobacteriaceae bacterium HL-DH10]
MAQDIRDLFKDDKVAFETMPENHQDRFLKKLDEVLPVEPKKHHFNWLGIAASVILFLGLGFGVYSYFQPNIENSSVVVSTQAIKTKTLGDVSPGLKKVEDYYLASINLELSKMKYTPETKDVFDGYLLQLRELDEEYKRLSLELTESGPTELTINALIDNLKFRLNLLYRLRSQLKEFNTSETHVDEVELMS